MITVSTDRPLSIATINGTIAFSRHARLLAAEVRECLAALDRCDVSSPSAASHLDRAFRDLDRAADHAVTARLHLAAITSIDAERSAYARSEVGECVTAFFATRNALATIAMHAVERASRDRNTCLAAGDTVGAKKASVQFDRVRAQMDAVVGYVPFLQD